MHKCRIWCYTAIILHNLHISWRYIESWRFAAKILVHFNKPFKSGIYDIIWTNKMIISKSNRVVVAGLRNRAFHTTPKLLEFVLMDKLSFQPKTATNRAFLFLNDTGRALGVMFVWSGACNNCHIHCSSNCSSLYLQTGGGVWRSSERLFNTWSLAIHKRIRQWPSLTMAVCVGYWTKLNLYGNNLLFISVSGILNISQNKSIALEEYINMVSCWAYIMSFDDIFSGLLVKFIEKDHNFLLFVTNWSNWHS